MRSWMLTLKNTLSEPLHTADEETAEKLFDGAREAIENHFDLRRATKISEK